MVFYYIKLQKLPMIRSIKFNYLLDFQVDFVKPLIKHFKFSFAIQKLRVSILTNIKLISMEYRNCSCFAKAKIIKLS